MSPEIFKSTRLAAGWSKATMAAVLEVSTYRIKQWEQGIVEIPRVHSEYLKLITKQIDKSELPAIPDEWPPERIVAVRARIGDSQADLARRLQISRSAVYNWEAGITHPREHYKKMMRGLEGCILPRPDKVCAAYQILDDLKKPEK
jgi:DNA-binding transcriptional regulator YiaG